MKNLKINTHSYMVRSNYCKSYHYKSISLITGLFFAFFLVSCKKSLRDAEPVSVELRETAAAGSSQNRQIGINVLLNTAVTPALVNELKTYGKVGKIFNEINALTMLIESNKLAFLKNLSFVSSANPDVEVQASPVDAVAVSNFANGLSTWNLDAVNVTELGVGRTVPQDGTGVFVGVLDTGLPNSWRQYFPEERIAVQYAKAFGGGGMDLGNTPELPNQWEHDQNFHGVHVTSTIIGYRLRAVNINGVAPKANIIPVKILNQAGFGWNSTIAQGILYIAGLKNTVLQNSPVVINMSLGGPNPDALSKAAIDYAISKGVIIVAAAGNSGSLGMGYPAAYSSIISVAAASWVSHFSTPNWWYDLDVPDPTNPNNFRIAGFSSRRINDQDLDVAAPGVAVVGPYQTNSGHLSYYFLSGTSMASPHVAGIVALMAQKKPTLTAAEAEIKLQSAAIPMAEGTNAAGSGFITANAALSGL